DGHTHMDAQIFWDPMGTCSCWHGVTTVVMGNCGFTLAPCGKPERHLVVRNLERAEDIAAEAMDAGIDWTWTTFPEFLDRVEGLPKGINYAGYIGHSALRTYVMGERAFEKEAGEDDLRAMERELRDAIRAGAIGFTTLALTEPRDPGPASGGQPPGLVGRGAPAGRRDGRHERGRVRAGRRAGGRRSRAPARLSRAAARSGRRERAPHHVGPVQPARRARPLAHVSGPARRDGGARRPDVRAGAQP